MIEEGVAESIPLREDRRKIRRERREEVKKKMVKSILRNIENCNKMWHLLRTRIDELFHWYLMVF